MSDETQIGPQPAPEADEREALAAAILEYREMWDEAVAGYPPNDAPEGAGGFVSADLADWLADRGFRRSQPAPRTVSAAEVLSAMEERAAVWSAMSDRMTQAVMADPHQSGYTSDDLIRYAAYAAAWNGAVAMLRAEVTR